MKILILGHYEIASNYAISLVVDALNLEHEIKIMLSGRGDVLDKMPCGDDKKSFAALAKYEQELCDELNTGLNSLNLNCHSFNTLADMTGYPIELLKKPNSLSGLKKVREFVPDLIISIRFRRYLEEELISIPKSGVINLHSGRLPEYRGAMATFWSMLNQEKHIGTVVHFISDAGVDTGPVILESLIECDYSKSYLANVLSLYPAGAQNVISSVHIIANDQMLPSEPQAKKGRYYSFPTEQKRVQFLNKGHSFF